MLSEEEKYLDYYGSYATNKKANDLSEEEIRKILLCENIGELAYCGLLDKLDESNNNDLNELKKQAIQGLLDLYNKEKEERQYEKELRLKYERRYNSRTEENKKLKEKNKELEKYDYRKIKIEENDKISSIHFTKEQLDLMNLGIALYVGIPKLLADTEDEETDI